MEWYWWADKTADYHKALTLAKFANWLAETVIFGLIILGNIMILGYISFFYRFWQTAYTLFFSLSRFSFTNTGDLKGNRRKEGTIFAPLYNFHSLANILTFPVFPSEIATSYFQ